VALKTSITGIFPSDLILRSCIIQALADLRANPWLLEYCFAALPADDLTAADYGDSEVARAREWFQRTNIPVFLNINANEAKFPCITIGLQSSVEVEIEGSLADINADYVEDNDYNWPTLVGPITPTNYNSATGILSFNDNQLSTFIVVSNMFVVDKAGNVYPILKVDDNDIYIPQNTVADFTDLLIKPQRPSYQTALESTIYRESYIIGCYVDSEPIHLVYLHTILIFLLLRYKQAYLEARGF